MGKDKESEAPMEKSFDSVFEERQVEVDASTCLRAEEFS